MLSLIPSLSVAITIVLTATAAGASDRTFDGRPLHYWLGPLTYSDRPSQELIRAQDFTEVLKRLNEPDRLEHTSMRYWKVADVYDAPRQVPLIGSAMLHHEIYRCELELKHGDAGVVKVFYVDRNHFHVQPAPAGQ